MKLVELLLAFFTISGWEGSLLGEVNLVVRRDR